MKKNFIIILIVFLASIFSCTIQEIGENENNESFSELDKEYSYISMDNDVEIYDNFEDYLKKFFIDNNLKMSFKYLYKILTLQKQVMSGTRDYSNNIFKVETDEEKMVSILRIDGELVMTMTFMPIIKFNNETNKFEIFASSGIFVEHDQEDSSNLTLRHYDLSDIGGTIYETRSIIKILDDGVIITEEEIGIEVGVLPICAIPPHLIDIFKPIGFDPENFDDDDDGDGWPNWLEWLAGTDPNDPNDHPDGDPSDYEDGENGDEGGDDGGNEPENPEVDYNPDDDVCDDPNDPEFYEDGGRWVYVGNGLWVYINGNGEVVGWYNEETGEWDGNIDNDVFNPWGGNDNEY